MKAALAAKLCLLLAAVLVVLLVLAWIPAPEARRESRASVSLVVHQPRQVVWEVISDLADADAYVPNLESVTLQPGIASGVGASRRVVNSDGRVLDETVTEWREGEAIVLRLHRDDDAPFPFARASFEYRLQAMSPDVTAVHLTLVYQPRYGVLGQLLDRWVLADAVEQQVMGVATGLKRAAEERAWNRNS